MSVEAKVRREVEVDTALAGIWQREQAARVRLGYVRATLGRMAGAETYWIAKRLAYKGSNEELRDAVAAKLVRDEFAPWDKRDAEKALDEHVARMNELHDLRAEAAPFEAEHAATGWSRFFLVTNSNGHIHATMACATCRPTTQFAWLPELSGLTEKDAVEAHGPHLCSVCFPTAPVEWTVGEQQVDPDQCPGSGTRDVVEGSHRTTGWSGNGRAICKHCKQGVSTTSTYKIRKHQKAGTS